MTMASNVLTGLVALLHLYFLTLEMFLWATPTGMRVFKRTREEQESTKVLAANQGLYNGFLVAGLVWSYWAGSDVRVFFLVCIVVAGIYGGLTAVRSILFAQALPAAAALAATLLAR